MSNPPCFCVLCLFLQGVVRVEVKDCVVYYEIKGESKDCEVNGEVKDEFKGEVNSCEANVEANSCEVQSCGNKVIL